MAAPRITCFPKGSPPRAAEPSRPEPAAGPELASRKRQPGVLAEEAMSQRAGGGSCFSPAARGPFGPSKGLPALPSRAGVAQPFAACSSFEPARPHVPSPSRAVAGADAFMDADPLDCTPGTELLCLDAIGAPDTDDECAPQPRVAGVTAGASAEGGADRAEAKALLSQLRHSLGL